MCNSADVLGRVVAASQALILARVQSWTTPQAALRMGVHLIGNIFVLAAMMLSRLWRSHFQTLRWICGNTMLTSLGLPASPNAMWSSMQQHKQLPHQNERIKKYKCRLP